MSDDTNPKPSRGTFKSMMLAELVVAATLRGDASRRLARASKTLGDALRGLPERVTLTHFGTVIPQACVVLDGLHPMHVYYASSGGDLSRWRWVVDVALRPARAPARLDEVRWVNLAEGPVLVELLEQVLELELDELRAKLELELRIANMRPDPNEVPS